MENITFLLNAVLQVILFTLFPFGWWIATGRKSGSFARWIGWKRPVVKNKFQFAFYALLTIFLFVGTALITPLLANSSVLATTQFTAFNFTSLTRTLIYAMIQTSLSEEIFFRGFLAKRLINKFGFDMGNIIQAALFGLLHGVMFIPLTSLGGAVVITLITASLGWLMGFLNERQANGSFIFSWLLHGSANILSALLAMLGLYN